VEFKSWIVPEQAFPLKVDESISVGTQRLPAVGHVARFCSWFGGNALSGAHFPRPSQHDARPAASAELAGALPDPTGAADDDAAPDDVADDEPEGVESEDDDEPFEGDFVSASPSLGGGTVAVHAASAVTAATRAATTAPTGR
jgi:hypothetical protein